MKPYIPERVVIESAVQNSEITRNVLARVPDVPVEIIDSAETMLHEAQRLTPSITLAKKTLILAEFKGKYFKPCPGRQSRAETRNVCCDYYVINFASNCHMECTYCYLQSYLNFPYMIVYADIARLITELDEALSANREVQFRIGTGELADSLALDPLTRYSVPLVEFFARQPNGILELKTKSNCVENLLDLDHQGRTVVAWSVNPEYIQQKEELKTSTIEQRLEAARRCVEAGYPVAFHFDPMVHYEGWEEGYRTLIKRIFDRIPPHAIAWISLGALRMQPGQLEIMKERFPNSILPLGELVPAEDGKLRYFKPIRTELYSSLRTWIEESGSGVKVYACMERPEVWRKAFGSSPESDEALGRYLVELAP
ncbi:MAG: radical SAM protein [Acidobacteriota bacterium]|nr:MAG: radical SAM protein [Acidobacteriota bacterium]